LKHSPPFAKTNPLPTTAAGGIKFRLSILRKTS